VVDDKIEPGRSPRPRRQYAVIEALGENASIAQSSIAAEASRDDHKPNLPPRERQIGETSLIPAVDPPRTCSASGTQTRGVHGTDGDHGRGAITNGALHAKPAWDQDRRAQSLLHRVDSFVKPT
jgi:hypothetical protein